MNDFTENNNMVTNMSYKTYLLLETFYSSEEGKNNIKEMYSYLCPYTTFDSVKNWIETRNKNISGEELYNKLKNEKNIPQIRIDCCLRRIENTKKYLKIVEEKMLNENIT